jgi:hypothetical protein
MLRRRRCVCNVHNYYRTLARPTTLKGRQFFSSTNSLTMIRTILSLVLSLCPDGFLYFLCDLFINKQIFLQNIIIYLSNEQFILLTIHLFSKIKKNSL